MNKEKGFIPAINWDEKIYSFIETSDGKVKRTFNFELYKVFSPPPIDLSAPYFISEPETSYFIKRRLIEKMVEENIRNSYYVPTDQPYLEDLITRQITSLETNKYNERELAAIMAYTYFGDRLINNLLREEKRDIEDLLTAMLDKSVCPFSWQVYDFYEYLASKGVIMPPKDTLYVSIAKLHKDSIDYDPNSELTKEIMKLTEKRLVTGIILKIVHDNFDFFSNFENIKPLIFALFEHLMSAFLKAPRSKGPIKVYRGVSSEHQDKLKYTSNDFLSTSANPYIALEFTNKKYFNVDHIDKYACVYEITIMPGVRVFYLQPFSLIKPPEVEILLPPGLVIESSDKLNVKKIIPQDTISKSMKKLFGRKMGYVYTIDLKVLRFDINSPVMNRLKSIWKEAKEKRTRKYTAAITKAQALSLDLPLSKRTLRSKSRRSLRKNENVAEIPLGYRATTKKKRKSWRKSKLSTIINNDYSEES